MKWNEITTPTQSNDEYTPENRSSSEYNLWGTKRMKLNTLNKYTEYLYKTIYAISDRTHTISIQNDFNNSNRANGD